MGQPLEEMGLTNIFALYKPDDQPGRLVRRLDGAARFLSDYAFIPVECWDTGERIDPRIDLLHLVTEMEVIALASK